MAELLTPEPSSLPLETPERKRVDRARNTVLLVEDDPQNREALLELLSEWDWEVISVGSSEEAEFAVRHRQIQAAIVDVFLPGRSGATLLLKLREQFPNAVLIGVSGLSDNAMGRALKGIGADAFIGKPIDPDELSRVLSGPHVSWH